MFIIINYILNKNSSCILPVFVFIITNKRKCERHRLYLKAVRCFIFYFFSFWNRFNCPVGKRCYVIYCVCAFFFSLIFIFFFPAFLFSFFYDCSRWSRKPDIGHRRTVRKCSLRKWIARSIANLLHNATNRF